MTFPWIYPFSKTHTDSPQPHSPPQNIWTTSICRQATFQSTMTCSNTFPKSPLWYIYNCTMSSSYIVRGHVYFHKAERLLPLYHRKQQHNTPTARACDSQCITEENSKKRRGCVYVCVCVVRGESEYLHQEMMMIKFQARTLTEIKEWHLSVSARNLNAWFCVFFKSIFTSKWPSDHYILKKGFGKEICLTSVTV